MASFQHENVHKTGTTEQDKENNTHTHRDA